MNVGKTVISGIGGRQVFSLRRLWPLLVAAMAAGVCALRAQAPAPDLPSAFHVKYVAAGVVYLDGGRGAGLTKGMQLTVRRLETSDAPDGKGKTQKQVEVAKLRVASVADVSSVCEVVSTTADLHPGDVAYLDESAVAKEVEQREMGPGRKYLQTISFTEGNPLEEEARAAVPRPPLPEVNRARGLIGFEYGGLFSGGPFSAQTSQFGLLLRTNITRINGTYWNLNGFWRGRLDTRAQSSQQQTFQNLLNRTYTFGLTYDNPQSHWVGGLGRLYLPWATSLDTIDGGYVGRHIGKTATAGFFAGSTPDPTSWDYNPNRRIAGTFVNFTGGDFNAFHYTSTFGIGVSTVGWSTYRNFVFTENDISYKQYFSIYEALRADKPNIPGQNNANLTGVSRSFVTMRIQPNPRISFEVNHNYFRDIPTFDLGLVTTGLLDQFLFQGWSAGVSVEPVKGYTIYNSLGRNSGTGDAKSSWNQMYGLTVAQIWRTGFRGDVRYSKFDSSFGSGNYASVSLSRQITDTFRWEVLAGRQSLFSPLSKNTSYRTLDTHIDWFPKGKFYLDAGFTRQMGNIQSYSQWYTGIGYRFDSYRGRRREALK
ncbi:MAG: hypothetical protein LAP13_05905 [Acidobacteriia bacterium]|nr:hypothetical protein [Terriglobia bacterium]